MIRWISVKEKPPVNIKDDFDNRNNISERLLVWVENYGEAFAKYYHKIKTWNIEGYSTGHFKVTHWAYINKP